MAEYRLDYTASEINGLLKKIDEIDELELNIPITSNEDTNSLIINEGTATGKYAIAGGTDDFDVIKNMTNNEIAEEDMTSAIAEGAMSIAYGPNSKAISTGTIAIGTNSIAGCKGFYWHHIDGNTIYLTVEQKPFSNKHQDFNKGPVWNEEAKNALSKWSLKNADNSDVYISITKITNQMCMVSKLTDKNIDNGTITLESVPFDQNYVDDNLTLEKLNNFETTFDFQDFSVHNPFQPEAGVVEYGTGSYAHGLNAKSTGLFSFALGRDALAGGNGAFAEGRETIAGYAAHAEGRGAKAYGSQSHAEGYKTIAYDNSSHAEGYQTEARGAGTHTEGYNTKAEGQGSHAEGYSTEAVQFAHAEGHTTKALYKGSHTEGAQTVSGGEYQHIQGKYNKIMDENYAHVVGNGTSTSNRSNAHTLDWKGNAWFKGDIYVGGTDQTTGAKKLATIDDISGANIDTSKLYITAGKKADTTIGNKATAEGSNTTASSSYAHAEGYQTKATQAYAHAEGGNTEASAKGSHAEGYETAASGDYSHAEGRSSKAKGHSTHAEGYATIAGSDYQHVQGQYNIEDNSNTYAHIVGNGSSLTRSNAHTLTWDGEAWYAKSVVAPSFQIEKNINNNKINIPQIYAKNITFKQNNWTLETASNLYYNELEVEGIYEFDDPFVSLANVYTNNELLNKQKIFKQISYLETQNGKVIIWSQMPLEDIVINLKAVRE